MKMKMICLSRNKIINSHKVKSSLELYLIIKNKNAFLQYDINNDQAITLQFFKVSFLY